MNRPDDKTPTRPSPLVSIVCRSINRPLLRDALHSIIAQTYSPIEVVLVDCLAAGIDVDSEAATRLKITRVTPEKTLGRSQSANAGLNRATGDYLMFLDDDDWIAPDHIRNLINAIQSEAKLLAVYSSVEKVTVDGRPTGEIFEQDFDPVLLRRDNYIPIHAVLFARQLLDSGCRFDESLDIYEDWDFWLQVSRHTRFQHIAPVTAYYRQGGSSDTADVDARTRYQPGNAISAARSAVLGKWKQIFSGNEINEMLGSLDRSAELRELAANVDALHATIRQLDQRLVSADETSRRQSAALQEKDVALDGLQHRLLDTRKELDDKRQNLEAVSAELEKVREHAALLNRRIDAIYQSPSWRIMGPFRRIRRRLSGAAKPDEH